MGKYVVRHIQTGETCVIVAENKQELLKKLDSGRYVVSSPKEPHVKVSLKRINVTYRQIKA